MARIIIAGDAAIVESAYTLEQIKTLEKYRPRALTLLDEDGKTVVFKVGTTTGKGSINNYGASFDSESRNEGRKAIITLSIPKEVLDAETFVEDVIGVSIISLNRVEEQFDAALASVEEERQTVRANITVM